MHSFFDYMAPWPRNEGSLHVYALPDDTARERLVAASERLEGLPGLPRMPEPWLHLTVSRLAHFDDIPSADLSRLGAALDREVAGLGAFDVQLGTPWAFEHAVGVAAPSTPQWEELVSAVRRAAVDALGGELPRPPHAPHTSLAYAIDDVDSAVVEARLQGLEEIGPNRISRVHLVSVTVRPERGTFDWLELANVEL
ncbi:MAG: 2'-5' RNA ligase family protein [Arachnia sp.]